MTDATRRTRSGARAHRCVYCGCPVNPEAVACYAHRDLLAVDARYQQVVRVATAGKAA